MALAKGQAPGLASISLPARPGVGLDGGKVMIMSADEAYRLREYTQTKQEVAALVRAGKQILHSLGETEGEDQCQALLVKLAEDRFNLAVVGQFKRGKSSLMNAVIGRALLPTGLLPLTSAITALCFGPRERAVLRRKGWSLEPEITLGELDQYVTEHGNPGNEKGLIEARVELPLPFLRGGLYFIDTPGIGSARQENTATTYEFLPEADAIVFVTSVEAPLSEVEERFLQDIRRHVRKLFVVVNKVDLLAAHEREQVLAYIQGGIERSLGANGVRLFPLSAQRALEAKLGARQEGLGASGLEEFEAALTAFVTEEKNRAFLVAILDRLLRIVAEHEGRASVKPGRKAARTGSADADLAELSSRIGSVREDARALRAALLPDGAPAEDQPAGGPWPARAGVLDAAVRAGVARQQRIGGRAIAVSRTCSICAVQSQVLFDFYSQWQHALATNPDAQREFAAARGFCPVHTWQFQRVIAAQDLSAGYIALTQAVAAELRRLLASATEHAAAAIATLLPDPETCPACRVLRDAVGPQIRLFLAQIATEEGRTLYARSPGLCLPHLRMALTVAESAEATFLLGEQARHLEETLEDLHGYVLKREALRRELLNANEESAWQRVLIQLVGEPTAQFWG